MKHLVLMLSLTLSLTLAGALAGAAPAPKGPDFSDARPARFTDRSIAASDATKPIMPTDVVAFRYNSDVVTEGALSQLIGVASWMAKHPDQRLILEAHTDRVGNPESNADLAARRADSVRDQLILRGVQSDRIVLEVYADVGARGQANDLDRAVIMTATLVPVVRLVEAALDRHHAVGVTWTANGMQYTETPPVASRARITAKRLTEL